MAPTSYAATYIEEAAGRLRDAMGALQGDISTMQHETYQKERRLQGEIMNDQNERTMLRAERAATNDDNRKHEIDAKERELEAQIKQKEQEATKRSADAARVVQDKNAILNTLQGIVSKLDSLAPTAG